MAIKDTIADPKNKLKHKTSSTAKIVTPSLVIHKWKTKINPAETPADNKRYMV